MPNVESDSDVYKEVSKGRRAALSATSLTKLYPIISSSSEGLKFLCRAVLGGANKAVESACVVKALDGVSLEIEHGEKVGVIGRNGAGKSTLLNLISGGIESTGGSISLDGPVHSISAGNLGFDTELSAYDNVLNYLNRDFDDEALISRHMQSVEEFCELGDYFYQPLKTYSLGMQVRVEFAASTAAATGIITIDEALGAGDIYWSEKCASRMDDLCASGCTLLLVSHSTDQILRYCDRAVWIEKGCVMLDGPVEEVVRRYEVFLERMSWYSGDVDDKSAEIEDVMPSLGDVCLELTGQKVVRWPGRADVTFEGIEMNGEPYCSQVINKHEALEFSIRVKCHKPGKYKLRYLINFWSRKGKRMAILENEGDEVTLDTGDVRDVNIQMAAGVLGANNYLISFTMFDLERHQSAAVELDTRLDAIYKSFDLTMVSDEAALFTLPSPVIRQI